MKHIKKIKIDIDKKNYEVIPSVQYDSNTRFLHINLLNGSVPFNLTGCSVKISGTKADGKAIFNNCTVINAKEGFIEVELTEQMNAAPGTLKCELKLYNGKGVLTTKQFDIEVTASVTSKEITSSNEFKALTDTLNEAQRFENRIDEIANKGTTTEVLKKTTEAYIQKKLDDGTIANLTLGKGSVTTEKLGKESVTQEKIHPDVKLGVQINDDAPSDSETWSSNKIDSVSLKVRDLKKGESVVNIALITGDKYQEALFDFSKLSAEDVKVSDEKDPSKFFSLSKVEPSEGGAYALGYNGQLVSNPQAYSVGLIFKGNKTDRTGIFKLGNNFSVNFEGGILSFTSNNGYYKEGVEIPLDLDIFAFLLIGIDMLNDTANVWINGVKKASFSLGGRKIGNIGYLNKGYWSDGTCIFNKIALFNKANFTDRELKAITEHIFTTRYINVDTSKSFLSAKNGLVRHLTMKNNNGVIKDVVYKDIVRNTTSITTQGFVLSERTLIAPNYNIVSNGGSIFIRFDKTSDTDNKYLFKYSDTEYLWVNFNSNRICCRSGGQWIIDSKPAQFSNKNVLCITNFTKLYLNGEYLFDFNLIFRRNHLDGFIRNFKNEYPIKDYVCYAEPLNDDEIKIISTELCSY